MSELFFSEGFSLGHVIITTIIRVSCIFSLYKPSVSVIKVTLVTEVSGNLLSSVTSSLYNPIVMPPVVYLNKLMPLVAGYIIPISEVPSHCMVTVKRYRGLGKSVIYKST